jgi:hypothetical protein
MKLWDSLVNGRTHFINLCYEYLNKNEYKMFTLSINIFVNSLTVSNFYIFYFAMGQATGALRGLQTGGLHFILHAMLLKNRKTNNLMHPSSSD